MTDTTPHLPTCMPTDNRPSNLGTSMNDDTSRLDGVAKATGAAKYSRDVYPDGALFIAFIRCPWGDAELVNSDTAAAEATPGVVEVSIERNRGRYHGQNLGYVVAESLTSMRRGLAALAPTWTRSRDIKTGIGRPDPLPAPGEKSAEIFNRADHVIEATYTTPVQTHSALETHGSVVDYAGDQATVYASTQGTFAARDGLGDALGLPQSQFEVVCEYIGGGFGSKLNGAGKEGMTAARVAAKYERPTYLFVTRSEDHLDTGNRPSSVTQVRIGVSTDGDVLGGQIKTWGGVGVARGGGGLNFPSGRYSLGQLDRGHADVKFNGGGPRPFRAPGQPQAAFAEELMLDEVAAAIEWDPLTLRKKLETQDDRRAMYEVGSDLIGWDRRRPNGTQTGVIRTGFGMGSTDWGRYPAPAAAEVVVNRDGSVEVRTGTQDIGQGQRTAMGAVAAHTLGIPMRHVSVQIGRSSLPRGPASGGSMTAHNTAPAVMRASDDAKEKLLKVIARHGGHDAGELDVRDGVIVHGDESVMDWTAACALLPEDSVVGEGQRDEETMRRYGGEGHSMGCQFAEVAVDVETGVVRVKRIVAVQACGRVMIRKGAESQIIGGVIQGLSYALFENKLLDRNTGAMVNDDLEWYKIAGSKDMPLIEPILWTEGQTGVRSLGEPPTVPTAGAIACAVFNAIGTPVRDLPLTPDRVLAALSGGAS